MIKQEMGRVPKVELVLQLAAFLVVFLGIPFLRQAIGFIYLSFLPGFLILKVFNPNKINWLKSVLFSFGLSIAFLMFLGLLINEIYPVLGNLRPLSFYPIVISVFAVTMVLYLVTRRRSTDFLGLARADVKSRASILLVGCISAITIVGTILGSLSNNNLVLLFLVILTSAIVLCSFSKKLIPTDLHPLVIFTISFFLLFSVSLISKYLVGYDINLEMNFAKLTYNASFWDKTVPYTYNSMLSVTILPVIYSNFLGLDLTWVFKVVYPLIYSIVPLTLYLAYRKLTSSRIALLSVFLFMLMDTFYTEMMGLARQMIAEVFFALLILLIVEDRIALRKRKLLFAIFGAALIVSHYALSYIFMFYLLLTFLLLSLLKHSNIKLGKLLDGKLILLFISMIAFWYIFVAPITFWELTKVVSNIYNSIIKATPSPGISGLMPAYVSPLHETSHYLFYAVQALILVGLLGLIVKRKRAKFNQEYISMSLISTVILILTITVPAFAATLDMTRFYHITLFFLAPFSALGCMAISRLIVSGKFRLSTFLSKHRAIVKRSWILVFSVLLVLLFLFQVGFIYEVTGDVPTSLPLSLNRLLVNPLVNINLYQTYNPEQNVLSAEWLAEHTGNQADVYADKYTRLQVLTSYGKFPMTYSRTPQFYNWDHMLSEKGTSVGKGAYVYLSQLNVVYGEMEDPYGRFWTFNSSSYLGGYDKIFSNGGSDIYINP